MSLNFICESDSYRIVPVRMLTKDEYLHIMLFKKMLSLVVDFWANDKTRKSFNEFKSKMQPFLKYPYSKPIKITIDQIEDQLSKIENARIEVPSILPKYSSEIEKLEKLFLSKNISAAITQAKKVKAMSSSLKLANQTKNQVFKSNKNPFEIQDPLFFQTNDFIRSFGLNDMKSLINKDIKQFKFSYLVFPKNMLNNYQYLVYFIQQLQDKNDPVALGNSQYIKWQDYFYQNKEEFNKLKKLADEYFHSNDKKKLIDLMNLLEKFPELKETNEKLKYSYSTLFRGLGWRSEQQRPSDTEIERQEKKSKYVSTSKFISVATRFAEGRRPYNGRPD